MAQYDPSYSQIDSKTDKSLDISKLTKRKEIHDLTDQDCKYKALLDIFDYDAYNKKYTIKADF